MRLTRLQIVANLQHQARFHQTLGTNLFLAGLETAGHRHVQKAGRQIAAAHHLLRPTKS